MFWISPDETIKTNIDLLLYAVRYKVVVFTLGVSVACKVNYKMMRAHTHNIPVSLRLMHKNEHKVMYFSLQVTAFVYITGFAVYLQQYCIVLLVRERYFSHWNNIKKMLNVLNSSRIHLHPIFCKLYKTIFNLLPKYVNL